MAPPIGAIAIIAGGQADGGLTANGSAGNEFFARRFEVAQERPVARPKQNAMAEALPSWRQIVVI
jgi:hypothetical protein